jgi:hypothetical protein
LPPEGSGLTVGRAAPWLAWALAVFRALAAGAYDELAGLTEEHKRVKNLIGGYFCFHTTFAILLDARVIRGPVAESLVSAAAIGYYILYSQVGWAFHLGRPLAARHHLLGSRRMTLPLIPPLQSPRPKVSHHPKFPVRLWASAPACLCWLGHARVAPEGGNTGKVVELPPLSLGQSLRNLVKVVQVRAPPPQAAHGVRHGSVTA